MPPEEKNPPNLPGAIFLDTSILDGHHYHFGSRQLVELGKVAKTQKTKLILTGAVNEEIGRHISERAEGAVAAIAKTRREHPFVLRVPGWPNVEPKPLTVGKLRSRFLADWATFQKNFVVEDLGFKGVDLAKVVHWYSTVRPPFGTGEKRKEFPDAFTVCSLIDYAKAQGITIAVVSGDNDMAAACKLYPEILHFPTVADLVELLLSTNARLASAQALLQAQRAEIIAEIIKQFPDRGFYPTEDSSGDVEDVEVDEVQIEKLTVLALGHREFTATFQAEVNFSAYLSYDDPDSAIHVEDIVFALHRRRGTVSDQTSISGLVRFATDNQWKAVKELAHLEIDDEDIEVEGVAPIDDIEPDFNDIGD